MLAGRDEVTSGSIRIGDSDVTQMSPKHRDIAMVFQSYALWLRAPVIRGPARPRSGVRAGDRVPA